MMLYFSIIFLSISLFHQTTSWKQTSYQYNQRSELKLNRHVIKSLNILCSLICTLNMPVFAQIPSIDDYNTRSGTVIINKNVKPSISIKNTEILINKQYFQELKNNLQNSIKNKSSKRFYDDILMDLSSFKVFQTKYTHHDEIFRDKVMNDLSEELIYEVQQLIDSCRSQRVFYFNKDDLLQVNRMINDQDDDLIDRLSEDQGLQVIQGHNKDVVSSVDDEVLQYINNSIDILDRIIKVL